MFDMKVLFAFIFYFIFSGCTSAQEGGLPELQEVQVFQHLRNSITIDLFKNEDSKLTFRVGDEFTTEVDSMKSMFLKSLSKFSSSTIDNGFIKILLSADQALKMEDVEVLFLELRRLNLRKIIFVAKAKNGQKNDRWSKTGFMSHLLQFNKKEAEVFYKKRNLPIKKFERISDVIIEKRKKAAEKLNPPSEQNSPPIPEPREEFMSPTEESLKRNYPNAKVIELEISSKKKINVNGKKIKPDNLNDFMLKELLSGQCLFLLKTKRKANYGKYVVGMASVIVMIEKARNTYSMEKYNKSFENLDWRLKKVVRKEIPHLLLSEIVD